MEGFIYQKGVWILKREGDLLRQSVPLSQRNTWNTLEHVDYQNIKFY